VTVAAFVLFCTPSPVTRGWFGETASGMVRKGVGISAE
jgi:hypothetical protein